MAQVKKYCAVASRLFVAFCIVVLFAGCGGNPAASKSLYDGGSLYLDVQGLRQAPTTAWTYVWNQHADLRSLGTITGTTLYEGGRGLLELDLRTGKKILDVTWTQKPIVYLGAPLLWQNKLYGITSVDKATGTPGVGLVYERLSCVDATTGKILWQSDEVGTWEKPCGENLLILNGKIYLAACFPVPPLGKTLETNVHGAVGIWDAKTGKLTGRIPLPSGAYPGFTNLASDGTDIYGNATYEFAWSRLRSSLFRYDPALGKISWSVNYPTSTEDFTNIGTALAVDGTTLVTLFHTTGQPHGVVNGVMKYTTAGFDTATGRVLWTKSQVIPDGTHSMQFPWIASQQGTVFLTIHDGTLLALDIQTGKEEWSYKVGSFAYPGETKGSHINWYLYLFPMATRDVLYVRVGDSYLLALDPTTGTKLWEKALLTMDEQLSQTRLQFSIIPSDKGLVVVTAKTSDMYPVIQFWK